MRRNISSPRWIADPDVRNPANLDKYNIGNCYGFWTRIKNDVGDLEHLKKIIKKYRSSAYLILKSDFYDEYNLPFVECDQVDTYYDVYVILFNSYNRRAYDTYYELKIKSGITMLDSYTVAILNKAFDISSRHDEYNVYEICTYHSGIKVF